MPTFYNAAVERDLHDPRGYDVLFIDGAVKGSVLTRASHSCQPNAEMRVRIREGKYSVEMVTTREVRTGEEICWDYRCQTDSEKEMRRAICLCGSKNCRVSYLHYNGESELAAFADENCAVCTTPRDYSRRVSTRTRFACRKRRERETLGKGTPGKGTPGKRGGHGGKRADDHWKSALIAAGFGRMTRGCSRVSAPVGAKVRVQVRGDGARGEEVSDALAVRVREEARAGEAIEARAPRWPSTNRPGVVAQRAGRNATPPTVPREPSDADLRADAKAEASGFTPRGSIPGGDDGQGTTRPRRARAGGRRREARRRRRRVRRAPAAPTLKRRSVRRAPGGTARGSRPPRTWRTRSRRSMR